METFNIYINVDKCLNMYNYDIFFYRLQAANRFLVKDVQFYKDDGKQSLRESFLEIRNYMDTNPFQIMNYRIIFGMRTVREADVSWHETLLYRMLKIYYNLKETRLFINSRDKADKSLSVIMLYETNLLNDMPELKEYNPADDLEVLFSETGILPEADSDLSDKDIDENIRQYLKSNEEINQYLENDEVGLDRVTAKFLKGYLNDYLTEEYSGTDAGNAYEEESHADYDDNPETEESSPDEKQKRERAARLFKTSEYVQKLVGHYSVLRKEIDANNLAQNMLAQLSVTDFILSDLKISEEGDSDRSTLKLQSIENWKESQNNEHIQQKYGNMLKAYETRLRNQLIEMKNTAAVAAKAVDAPPYKEPETIEGREGLKQKSEEEYRGEFKQILEEFLRGSIRNKKAIESWKKTYRGIREKIKYMDSELSIFALDISSKYKNKLEERKNKNQQFRIANTNDIENETRVTRLKDIEMKKAENQRVREELLQSLSDPKMNASLKFQDQLNFEQALDECNQKVSFFVKCQSMITAVNYFITLALCAGSVLLHYFLLQNYALTAPVELMAMLIYISAAFILLLFSWNAPFKYFRHKIKKSIEELTEQMTLYIRGYFEKADNFAEYINLLNRLDAVSAYMNTLEILRKDSSLYMKKYDWHRCQLEKHLDKCSDYFRGLMDSVEFSAKSDDTTAPKLEVLKDIIHSKIYWPQVRPEDLNG